MALLRVDSLSRISVRFCGVQTILRKTTPRFCSPSLYCNEDLFSYSVNKTITWKEKKQTLNKYSPQSHLDNKREKMKMSHFKQNCIEHPASLRGILLGFLPLNTLLTAALNLAAGSRLHAGLGALCFLRLSFCSYCYPHQEVYLVP